VVPVFYRCTTACRLIEDSLLKVVTKAEIGRRFPGAKELTLGVGQDFDVVFLGLNPTETPELARNKKALMMSVVEVPRVTQNWTLLTGEMHQIREVTDALGFRFTYDAEKDILNHPTGSILLTPDGKVSAYTVGNAIPSRLLQANLEAAKQGGVAPAADQAMMFGCLTLDPETGRYRPVVHRILQVTGTLTVLILAFSILSMNRKYKRTTLLPGGPDA
jgi:protein SCO1/2